MYRRTWKSLLAIGECICATGAQARRAGAGDSLNSSTDSLRWGGGGGWDSPPRARGGGGGGGGGGAPPHPPPPGGGGGGGGVSIPPRGIYPHQGCG